MIRKIHIAIFLTAFAVATASFFMAVRTGRGQSPNPKTKSPVKPTVLLTNNTPASNAKRTSVFAAAASQNAILRDDLIWTFGGKRQKGWYLYDALIRHALGTDSDTGSVEFAEALAHWQERMGLDPNGVLDEDSFMALVSHWQQNRLKRRVPAEPQQLVTLPATAFYDPERVAELRQVERSAFEAYKEMIAAALADPTLTLARTGDDLAATEKYLKIISSFRTREYQERLRRASPHAGSAGLAVNSPHFTGRALDIYVGGDPVDTRDSNRAIQVSSPAYQWLVRNAERFGFRPYFYEPWHWEYVK